MNKRKLIEEWEKYGYKLKADNNRFTTFHKKRGAILDTIDICILEKCIEIAPTRDKEAHYFTRIEFDLANLIQKTMEWLHNEGNK